MRENFSIWREIFGRDRTPPTAAPVPEEGDVFYFQPDHGPIEYAQVIGVYTEAAEIRHIRFRLIYGYQEKTEDLGEKTLAFALFAKRYRTRLDTEQSTE